MRALVIEMLVMVTDTHNGGASAVRNGRAYEVFTGGVCTTASTQAHAWMPCQVPCLCSLVLDESVYKKQRPH